MSKFRDIHPHNAFFAIGLIYGCIFLLATPAFQVPDEYEHFYRAIYVSEGHIVPEKLGDRAGVYVPESIQKTSAIMKDKWYSYVHDKDNKTLDLTDMYYIPYKSKYMVFEDISRIAVVTYSPVPYIISGLAISIGKIFNISPLLLMYLGRLANLLSWILLTYYAIKITPVHKWVFFVISFIPLTLFEAASLSADSFMMGISLLTIAIFFKYAFDAHKKKINLKDIYILFIVLMLLALSKQIYLFLIFLLFLIPSKKFESRKKMFTVTLFLFLSILAITGTWSFIVKDLYIPIVPQISIMGQIFYILANPFRFLFVMLNTFLQTGLSYQILFVGNFLLDMPLPLWWIGLYLIPIIPISLVDNCKIQITLKQKMISLIIFILVFILVCAFVYISWTPVGQNTIDGIQGRYFIPIFPLLLILFYKWNYFIKIQNKIPLVIEKNFNIIITCYVALYLTSTLLFFIISYHV